MGWSTSADNLVPEGLGVRVARRLPVNKRGASGRTGDAPR